MTVSHTPDFQLVGKVVEPDIFLQRRKYFLVCKKKPVDFDDELKIGDVRYDNMI